MQKRSIVILLVVISLLVLTGCASEEEVNKAVIERQTLQIQQLESKVDKLKVEENQLKNSASKIKQEKGLGKYIITLNISQQHFTLDLKEHLKDAMNDIEIQIPVDKEFYDSIKEGDVLDDSFRVGSLVMKGSYGSWNVRVIKKEFK